MKVPRLRMIGGPNGSGKSTLLAALQARFTFPMGHILNPDLLERDIKQRGRMDMTAWGVKVDSAELQRFFEAHPLARSQQVPAPRVEETFIVTQGATAPYLVVILCDFLRKKWIQGRDSFTFETVMSGGDKLQLLGDSRAAGYRNYLYYVCTNDPAINRERVATRVGEGGHSVPEDKILSRYFRSLKALPDVLRLVDRACLFDNSKADEPHRLVAEFENGRAVRLSQDLPHWYGEHVLKASEGG